MSVKIEPMHAVDSDVSNECADETDYTFTTDDRLSSALAEQDLPDVTEIAPAYEGASYFLDVLLTNFPGGVCLYDKNLDLVLYNDKFKRMLDYPDRIFASGRLNMKDLFRFNAARGEYGPGAFEDQVEARMVLARKRIPHVYDRERPNGTVLEVRGEPIEGGGFITTYLDVTAQRQHVRQLEALVDNFPGGICLFDSDLRMVLHNEELKRLLDYPETLFAKGMPTLEDVFTFNARRGEYGEGDVGELVRHRLELARGRQPHTFERSRPNGTVVEVRGVPIDGSGFVTTYLDITEKRRNQEMIAHMAHHDALTDLPNRTLLMERLKLAVAQAKRGYKLAVHYLDLDKFKPVNDTHGHATGDALLKEVSQRLIDSVRDTDTVARIGGDEFVVLQVGIDSTDDTEVLAKRLIASLCRPFELGDHTVEIGTSVGIAMAPEHAMEPDKLIGLADAALYNAKAAGRRCYRIHAEAAE